MTRAELLKAWALESGFDQAGIAILGDSAQHPDFLAWLERGDQAGMSWLETTRDLRADPRQLLPGAVSALVVTLQYHPLQGETAPEGDLWPRVARYARGRDYHDVMKRRLKSLAARIELAFPGCRTRAAVDTAPILERELAARAGLGVQGKNTNLLNRGHGSFFLIGELLLTLELEPDPPIADLCGRCTRCLDFCPTGALVVPYRLDSRRCISYWTIEHRGDLPEAARELIGDWVFGCDVCQEVCPWNYKAESADQPSMRLPPERRALDLAGLLALDHAGYVERFKVTALKRAKLEGLKRNAAVVMGNRGDQRYLPALIAALDDDSEVVRRHAAWALGRLGGPECAAALGSALLREADPATRCELDSALAAAQAHGDTASS